MSPRSDGLSRRRLLSAGAAAATLLVEPAAGKTISGEVPWTPGTADAPAAAAASPTAPEAWQFLSSDEVAFLDAAVSRLIPNDDLGPGAKEAGITIFLDRQLAGPYGHASHWYMQGPWEKGAVTQGYQSRLTPAELYRAAIKDIDAAVGGKFSGKRFSELGTDQQDDVLKQVESGDLKLPSADAKTFFDMLLQNTTEGFFADPIYGGNKDMAGWKLIGFPGARYDYRAYVGKHNQKLGLEPVSIKGRPGWTPKS